MIQQLIRIDKSDGSEEQVDHGESVQRIANHLGVTNGEVISHLNRLRTIQTDFSIYELRDIKEATQ